MSRMRTDNLHLSVAEVRERIAYDPATGALTWRAKPARGRQIGDALAIVDNGNGYIYAKVNRRPFAVHRLAWVIVHGYWPIEVDHKNGDKADNRLVNLREATRSQNEMNGQRRRDNTSGYKGVGWHKCTGRWRAYIQKDGRQYSLGYHANPEAAHQAYLAAAAEHFGEFARAE